MMMTGRGGVSLQVPVINSFEGLPLTPQEWILCLWIFALGCCIGSFLNVVIYRLPREKSLVYPGSSCPHCGQAIRFYDNHPAVVVARAEGQVPPVQGSDFAALLHRGAADRAWSFWASILPIFTRNVRASIHVEGAWFVYLVHIILLSAFIAASAIDLELWIIPLSICWFVTAVGSSARPSAGT